MKRLPDPKLSVLARELLNLLLFPTAVSQTSNTSNIVVLSGAFLPSSTRIFVILTYTPHAFGNYAPKIIFFLMWYINVVVSDLLINTDVCSRCGDIRLCDQRRHSASCSPRNLKLTLVSGNKGFPFLFLFFIVQLQLAWTGAFRGKQSSLVFLCPTECDVQPARGKQQTPPRKAQNKVHARHRRARFKPQQLL